MFRNIYICYNEKFHILHCEFKNFKKKCSCTYYSKSLHITNSVRRIAYFCDGRVKKNMLLRVNRRKSCKKLLIYCFLVGFFLFFFRFSAGRTVYPHTDTHRVAVNSCKTSFCKCHTSKLKKKKQQPRTHTHIGLFCLTVEI